MSATAMLPPFTTAFISFEPAAAKATKATRKCIHNGCNLTNVAQKCGHRLCKRHCLQQATSCGHSGHDQARQAALTVPVALQAQGNDPFALVHPPPSIPIVPPAPPPSSSPPSTTFPTQVLHQPAPNRDLRVPMSSAFLADWNARTQAQSEKRRAEEQRRKNLALIGQSFSIAVWTKDGCEAQLHTVQGVPTWPTTSLASNIELMGELGLEGVDVVERYYMPSRTWRREQAQAVFKVRTDDTILFRLLGVKACVGFDWLCMKASQRTIQAPSSTVPQPATLHAHPTTSTLPSFSSEASMHSLVSATSAMSLASLPSSGVPLATQSGSIPGALTPSSVLPTPCTVASICPISPAASPVPQSSLPLSEDTSSISPLLPAEESAPPATIAGLFVQLGLDLEADLESLDLDRLWQLGLVYTPDLEPDIKNRPWPAGIFARDMAHAFTLLGDTNDDNDQLRKRFQRVFRGRPFKSATYHAQRSAWINSPQEQRDWIMNRPRTVAGLWTKCRKDLDGWKLIPRHS
ncbi:hypothetical protein C8Q73DRAFT_685290 [Cubamyces lactineus]|nr:hypothetical protein C8Q73DRAFT_685290 [Cubamyces lactineus]